MLKHSNALLEAIESAVAECGWNMLLIDKRHPFRFRASKDGENLDVRAYIGNITDHDGETRLAKEYRTRIVGVSRFLPESDDKALMLGWWKDTGIFVGYDIRKHRENSDNLLSLRIQGECLRQAYINGFSICPKQNREIAIAFQPAFLITYIAHLEYLHTLNESPATLATLQLAANSPEGVKETDWHSLSQDQAAVVRSVLNWLRSSNFRSRVLTAYGHRCAFCGQFDSIQAVHVVPDYHPSSSDETHNGIAACFLHHAAYDRGLVTFNEAYSVVVSEEKMKRFAKMRRDSGANQFRSALRPLILLPPSKADRPHMELVRLANQIRGWPM